MPQSAPDMPEFAGHT
ncbi:hypothetical protein AZE42_12894, partial [Rhizopogon vesiculosus]